MSEPGTHTALVWAATKEDLPHRINTLLAEFATNPEDLLHIGYAVARAASADHHDAAAGQTVLEYSALLVMRR